MVAKRSAGSYRELNQRIHRNKELQRLAQKMKTQRDLMVRLDCLLTTTHTQYVNIHFQVRNFVQGGWKFSNLGANSFTSSLKLQIYVFSIFCSRIYDIQYKFSGGGGGGTVARGGQCNEVLFSHSLLHVLIG